MPYRWTNSNTNTGPENGHGPVAERKRRAFIWEQRAAYMVLMNAMILAVAGLCVHVGIINTVQAFIAVGAGVVATVPMAMTQWRMPK